MGNSPKESAHPDTTAQRRAAFGQIYETRSWQRGVSLSGAGSDRDVAAAWVNLVNEFIAANQVTSVLDIGHGDWEMWPDDAFEGIQYTGVDVAAGLSEDVARRRGHPSRTFLSLDATSDPLPTADLVLVKEVLQHLSNGDVATLLRRLSFYRNVIICSDTCADHWRLSRFRAAIDNLLRMKLRRAFKELRRGCEPSSENTEIATGGYRPLNLDTKPWRTQKFGLTAVNRVDLPHRIWDQEGLQRRVWILSGSNGSSLPGV